MKKVLFVCMISAFAFYSCGKGSTAPADATAAVSVAVQSVVQGIGVGGIGSSASVSSINATTADKTNTVNYSCDGGGTVTGTSTVTGVDACNSSSSTTCDVNIDANVTLNACTVADSTCSKGNVVASGAMAVIVTATGDKSAGADGFVIAINYNTTEDLTITYNSKTYTCAIDLSLSGTVADLFGSSDHPENLFTGKVCGNDWTETWASINDATKKIELCTATATE